MQNSRREIAKRERCKWQESLENYLATVENTEAYIFKQLQQSIRHQPKKLELWVANENHKTVEAPQRKEDFSLH